MTIFTDGLNEALEHLSEGNYKSTFVPEFFLGQDEKNVLIQIVDKEPKNCYVHEILMPSKSGKEWRLTKACALNRDGTGECYYCECAQEGVKGVGGRVWRAHLTILDSRLSPLPGETKEGKKARWTRKLWRASARRITPLAQSLDIQRRKGILTAALILVSRTGTGKDTLYSYDYMSRKKLTKYKIFDDVTLKLGWNPSDAEASLFAPCPEFDGSNPVPFDYEEMLAPESYEDMAATITRSNAQKPSIADDVDDDKASAYFKSIGTGIKKRSRKE